MKKELITILALGVTTLGLSSCESPEEKAKRLAREELAALNIAATQYDALLPEEAAKGSVKRMQMLITAGADVNIRPENGTTPLCAAITSNNPNAVKLLLDMGANISLPDAQGRTEVRVHKPGSLWLTPQPPRKPPPGAKAV